MPAHLKLSSQREARILYYQEQIAKIKDPQTPTEAAMLAVYKQMVEFTQHYKTEFT